MDLPVLSMFQYSVITNIMSLCTATMGAGALFFFFSRQQVAPKYRTAMLITALVPAIACYHYFRINTSFESAYMLESGAYVPTGKPFNDAYRYADWLLTVPLLVIELVAVLALSRAVTQRLSWQLGGAAFIMILLGYPGEIATNGFVKFFWWFLAMIPFAYIIYELYTSFSKYYRKQPKRVRALVRTARDIILVTWSFYPIAYIGGMIFSGGSGEMILQVGYTIADITAKVGMGLYIYLIAVEKSKADGWTPDQGQIESAPGDEPEAAPA